MSGSLLDGWTCGHCGEVTRVRHFLYRDGAISHDAEAAYREVAGLDEPEPTPPDANRASS